MKNSVLTGGKFNCIHPGHIWLLCKAKKLGFLVVVLAHDKNNKRSYAVSSRKRLAQMKKLSVADNVIVGSPTRFVSIVKKIKPNIIVLGYDQKLPDKETIKYVKENKIKVVRFKRYKSYSTRNLCVHLNK